MVMTVVAPPMLSMQLLLLSCIGEREQACAACFVPTLMSIVPLQCAHALSYCLVPAVSAPGGACFQPVSWHLLQYLPALRRSRPAAGLHQRAPWRACCAAAGGLQLHHHRCHRCCYAVTNAGGRPLWHLLLPVIAAWRRQRISGKVLLLDDADQGLFMHRQRVATLAIPAKLQQREQRQHGIVGVACFCLGTQMCVEVAFEHLVRINRALCGVVCVAESA